MTTPPTYTVTDLKLRYSTRIKVAGLAALATAVAAALEARQCQTAAEVVFLAFTFLALATMARMAWLRDRQPHTQPDHPQIEA